MNSPQGLEYRRAYLDAIQQKQFELAYYAHIVDTDDMFPFELDSFYNKLSKRKKDEADAQEQANKERQKIASKPTRKKRGR